MNERSGRANLNGPARDAVEAGITQRATNGDGGREIIIFTADGGYA